MITAAVTDTNVMAAELLTGTGVSPVARILDGMRSGAHPLNLRWSNANEHLNQLPPPDEVV